MLVCLGPALGELQHALHLREGRHGEQGQGRQVCAAATGCRDAHAGPFLRPLLTSHRTHLFAAGGILLCPLDQPAELTHCRGQGRAGGVAAISVWALQGSPGGSLPGRPTPTCVGRGERQRQAVHARVAGRFGQITQLGLFVGFEERAGATTSCSKAGACSSPPCWRRRSKGTAAVGPSPGAPASRCPLH